jgi:hypothetical protein
MCGENPCREQQCEIQSHQVPLLAISFKHFVVTSCVSICRSGHPSLQLH